MATPDTKDWGRIHAKAWTDPKYRKLLETDPTAAVHQYAKESGKRFDKLMQVPDKPAELSEHDLDGLAHPPMACC